MIKFIDSRQIIERKKLQDKSELQLKRWTSDIIEPGRVGYQIALVSPSGNLTRQFPYHWENYTEEQIREMYDSISNERDFITLRDKCD